MSNWEYFEAKYGTPIGEGAQCRVYRKGDTVYKVLTDGHSLFSTMREAYALAAAEDAGIPVSNLHGVYTESGHIVMEMDYVAGQTISILMKEASLRGDAAAIDAYLNDLVNLQVQLHGKPISGLGDARRSFAFLAKRFPGLPSEMLDKLLKLMETLPDGDALCHNDFHARNVMACDGKYVIIDWDAAMIGDPAGDVAHSYLLCKVWDKTLSDVYPNYSERYLQKYMDITHMERARIEAWLPLHAIILYLTLVASAPDDAALFKPYLGAFL